jgi:hypothetical protein
VDVRGAGAAGDFGEAALAAGLGAEPEPAPGVADFLAAAFLVSPPEACSLGNVSLILRTTGGSMVDDADRTNSPWFFRCASRTLLSTPSSLASS